MDEDVLLSSPPKAAPRRNDMQNCFGFDDEDEDADDEELEEKTKPNIHILQSAIH